MIETKKIIELSRIHIQFWLIDVTIMYLLDWNSSVKCGVPIGENKNMDHVDWVCELRIRDITIVTTNEQIPRTYILIVF